MTEPETETQAGREAEPKVEPAPQPTPWLTYAAVAASVVVFVGRSFQSEPWSWEALRRWGVLSAHGIYDGGWWALVTSVFVHDGVLHFAFNLLWLWMLGRAFERACGFGRALLFFVGAAWVSSALELAVSGSTGLGLSGVGYALFGFMWRARSRFPSFRPIVAPVVWLFLGWLVFCFVVSHVGVMRVANTAHVAGLAFGLLLGSAALPRWRRAAIAGTALLGVVSTITVVWAPWSPTWHCFHAWKAMTDHDYDRAIADYSRAIEVDAAHAEAWRLRGAARRLKGDDDAAIADLTKAVELEPRSASALSERALARFQSEDYEGALDDCNEALRVHPGYPRAGYGLNALAWVRATSADAEVRDPPRAVELARRAVKLAPDVADFQTTLGAALYFAGQTAEALATLEASMERTEGGDAYDWYLVAMARHDLGRDDARVWYERGVAWADEHMPDNQDLERLRTETERVLGMGSRSSR